MRDAKDIIEDMRKIVKVSMMNTLKKINMDGYGREDSQEFSEEFDYLLELAEKGANLAAGETRIKTVAGVIDDLERQMMITGADSIDLSYSFEHKPYVFGVRLRMTDFEQMFAPGPHKEEFKRWKETISFLYGQNYADKFCSLETFKKHLSAMGFTEAADGQ